MPPATIVLFRTAAAGVAAREPAGDPVGGHLLIVPLRWPGCSRESGVRHAGRTVARSLPDLDPKAARRARHPRPPRLGGAARRADPAVGDTCAGAAPASRWRFGAAGGFSVAPARAAALPAAARLDWLHPPAGEFPARLARCRQRLAVVVETAATLLLFDAGPRLGSTDAGRLVVAAYLQSWASAGRCAGADTSTPAIGGARSVRAARRSARSSCPTRWRCRPRAPQAAWPAASGSGMTCASNGCIRRPVTVPARPAAAC